MRPGRTNRPAPSLLLAFLTALGGFACNRSAPPRPQESTKAERPSLLIEPEGASPLAMSVAQCSHLHRGLVIDLAAPGAMERAGFRLNPREAVPVVERAGEAFAALDQPTQDVEFWLPESFAKVGTSLAVRGTHSDRLTLALDGKPLGAIQPTADEIRSFSLPPRAIALGRGRHRLTIGLSRRRGSPPGAEVGWIRLGPDAAEAVDDPPLAAQAMEANVTLQGDRRHAWILREGSELRCPLWIAHDGSQLKTYFGLWGEGQAEVELSLLTGNGERQTLARAEVTGGEKGKWNPIVGELPAFAGHPLEIGLRALRVQSGARVAIDVPVVAATTQKPAEVRPARHAFVIVLGGLGPEHRPETASQHGLPIVTELAKEAVSYPDYRATSTSVRAVIASLMTGAPPWQHGAIDDDSGLAKVPPTLGDLLEARGGRAGYFTGVPTAFPVFGVARGFERKERVSPTEDRPAIEPLKQMRGWLESKTGAQVPLLGVVHLRGGHPPFDVNKERSLALPPAEYGGDLDARRAAIQLSQVRRRIYETSKVLPDEDWQRLEALQDAALLDQSRALTEFFAHLRREGIWDESVIVLLGDIGAGARPRIPFDDESAPRDDLLQVPVLIKFPEAASAGTVVRGTFGPEDVFETLRLLLGLGATPAAGERIFLAPETGPDKRVQSRPHLAYRRGAYRTRLGPFVLSGSDGRSPRLCRFDWDPTCTQDRTQDEPLVSALLWGTTFETLSAHLALPRTSDQKVELDDQTHNALIVWGVGE
jgi:Sulfatase